MNPNVLDLEKVVNKHGFELNPIKTKLMKRGSKQYVTGLSVFDSQFPRISKRIKRNLKLEIYYLNKFGFVSHTCKMLNYTNEVDKPLQCVPPKPEQVVPLVPV